MLSNQDISRAMQIKLNSVLPQMPEFVAGIRRAPDRGFCLSREQTVIVRIQ